MKNEMQHTPAPWQYGGDFIPEGRGWCKGGEGGSIFGPNGEDIVIGGCQDEQGGIVGVTKEANAAHIVHCCNLHQELVIALESARKTLAKDYPNCSFPTIDAVLAKAKGE